MSADAATPAQSNAAGIALALASALAFALAPASAKLAFESGANALTIVAIRSAAGAVLMLLLVQWAHGRLTLGKAGLLWSLVAGAFYGVTIYCFIASLATTSVRVAILIFFLHPLIIALTQSALGPERITLAKLALAGATLAALTVAIDPTGEDIDPIGGAYALASAVAMAGMVLLSARASRHASSMQISLVVNLLSALVFASLATFAGAWDLPVGMTGWLGIAGTSAALALGLLLFFAALRHIGAVRATMLTNIEPLLSIVVAGVMLGERLSPLQWTGAVGVVAGLVLFESASRKQG